MHIDLARALSLDRVTIAASLPVTVFEKRPAAFWVSPAGGAVGDPRLGSRFAPMASRIAVRFRSASGLPSGFPLRAIDSSLPLHTSEQGVRVLPKLVLGVCSAACAGRLQPAFCIGPRLRWAPS